MQSKATTVELYLKELPEDRRAALTAMREVILKNLPKGCVEVMNFGMISYEVPLSIAPKTYNGKPLMYAALANQKNHIAVYLCALYCLPGAEEKFRKQWRAGKLDMGKSCIRAKKLEDMDLDLIGSTIAATSVDEFVKASRK